MDNFKSDVNKLKNEQGLCAKIKTCLTYLGIDFSYLGAKYLCDIIFEVLKNPSQLYSLTTQVFDVVATKNMTTRFAVERNSRIVLIRAYEHGTLKEVVYFAKDKAPTIKQIVNFIYDYFIEFDYII